MNVCDFYNYSHIYIKRFKQNILFRDDISLNRLIEIINTMNTRSYGFVVFVSNDIYQEKNFINFIKSFFSYKIALFIETNYCFYSIKVTKKELNIILKALLENELIDQHQYRSLLNV